MVPIRYSITRESMKLIAAIAAMAVNPMDMPPSPRLAMLAADIPSTPLNKMAETAGMSAGIIA
jgi:ABC-type transporter Mla maintaining outer membrane lipid asymmetry permease subunit MlaE